MRTLSLVLVAGLLSACASAEASRQSVRVDMSNVDLHVSPQVTLRIRELRGEFVPTGQQIPYLDNKQSYAVAIDSGEIALDLATLNALIGRAFGGDNSNVEKLQLSIADDGTLRQKGKIDAAINIPFNAKSTVSVTGDGRIRVSTKSVKGFGVPITGVMKLFRVKMDTLVKVKPGHGVVVDGNDLIVDPTALIPSPAVRGRLTAVKVESDRLVQTFGATPAKAVADRRLSPNHIYWRRGQLSFGKLTMADTDLELVDLDPNDPFDFSVDDWNAQLVAGYSKTQPNRGLKAYMPDFGDLKK
jgi:hypothetical protein